VKGDFMAATSRKQRFDDIGPVPHGVLGLPNSFKATVFSFEIQYRTNIALFTLFVEQVSRDRPGRDYTELGHHIQQTPNNYSFRWPVPQGGL
jgi:hypothetical protein